MFIAPQSPQAQHVVRRLEALQRRFADGLDGLSVEFGEGQRLAPVRWLRDSGVHGGGHRLEITESALLNRCSLNISTIHYDDLPEKRLSSATALSCIVHPAHPVAPSLHMHISWTELRGSPGGWRMMADLNPSIPCRRDQGRFLDAVGEVFAQREPELLAGALAQGDRYFSIPALGRHRGVAHVYLEQWKTDDVAGDLALAERFGAGVIDIYLQLVRDALAGALPANESERRQQLDYHTLYLFQVLTLDRGTTSGLLVHDQNDVGIMGSLPNRVDRELLASWRPKLPEIQRPLLDGIVAALPEPAVLTPEVRVRLARTVRAHYRAHPEALAHQARGDVVPPTVANHGETGPRSE